MSDDVVGKNNGHQHQERQQPGDRETKFKLFIRSFSGDQLVDQEHHVPAIERGNGQEVQDCEIHAEHRQEHQLRRDPFLRLVLGDVDDLEGTANVTKLDLASRNHFEEANHVGETSITFS